jgi:hypothetical protein
MSSSTTTEPTTTSRRSGYIPFLKLLALTGVALDMMFHWLEVGNWTGVRILKNLKIYDIGWP